MGWGEVRKKERGTGVTPRPFSVTQIFLPDSGRNLDGRSQTELLQHRVLVDDPPVLDGLAIRDPADMDLRPGRLLARCRRTHELALLRTLRGQAAHDLVARVELVLDRVAEVGEGCAELREDLLDAREVRRAAEHRRAVHVIRGEQLVQGGPVPRVNRVDQSTHELLAVFWQHRVLLGTTVEL